MIDLEQAFAKLSDEYPNTFLEYDRLVPEPKPGPRDLLAFLKLMDLGVLDGNNDIVGSAEHDQIWLSVDTEKLAEVASFEDLRELYMLGVTWSEDSLSMFV